ncbi:MAG: proton-conducting transporter membrane subunit [Candidatus Omnitrophica bacterium]|nr:proton-conducting transporter membrane subunit [Candidatus Omnitrophota bacterium]
MGISLFFTIFSWILGGLVLIYSVLFVRKRKDGPLYFLYALLTLICASGAFLADNFVVFLVYWGSLLVLLYAMIGLGSFKTATRALIIVGIGDFCLILGVVYLIAVSGAVSINNFTPLATDNALNISAFLLIAVGAMIKAGIFGFHGWIVEAAETNPSTTMAFLPASLDKFLGIYLLVRACKDFFVVNEVLSVVVMAIGAVTILSAVLMALVQHDFKKLLAFHAVSQAGYMILGIASGTLIGMAGGLFHMLNNAIYKTCLFLSAGNIEHRIGDTELSKLGGLNKLMPITFIGTMIASLAISGVPPFNGFASKWMIYQGLLGQGASWVGVFKIIFLVMAMFGSVLTLASFMKVIYSAFMGDKPKELPSDIKEVPFLMQLPILILASLCIILGVFANRLMIEPFLESLVGAKIEYLGSWIPDTATVLILLSLLIGVMVYFLSRVVSRTTGNFIGGETLEDNKVLGTDFYLSVQDIKPLKAFYRIARIGGFDVAKHLTGVVNASSYVLFYGVDRVINFITDGLGKLVFVVSAGFKKAHNGLLDRYVIWLLLGFVLLIGVFLKCLNCM